MDNEEPLITLLNKSYQALIEMEEFQALLPSWQLQHDEDLGCFYIDSPLSGLYLRFSGEKILESVFLMSEEYHLGCKEYKSHTPFGLQFDLSRQEVRNKLGIPHKSGGGDDTEVKLHGSTIPYYVPSYDKYVFDEFTFHIEYKPDQRSIGLIIITMKKNSESLQG